MKMHEILQISWNNIKLHWFCCEIGRILMKMGPSDAEFNFQSTGTNENNTTTQKSTKTKEKQKTKQKNKNSPKKLLNIV